MRKPNVTTYGDIPGVTNYNVVKPDQHFWEVLVGNVGKVCETTNGFAARVAYNSYVRMSRDGYGRCAGESVTLWCDNEIVKEHEGKDNA